MKIDLVFIAYNRLEYTKMSLLSLLADPTEDFSLTIWDNGSTDGTREYLASFEDPRIKKRVFSNQNVGLRGGVNDLFSTSSADLVGIIPNDFLLTPGWTRDIAQAHADIPQLGMVGCWHFFLDDFDYERAKHKIQTFGQHRIFRHPWTGGGAGLVKLATVKQFGLLESNGTTNYWLRMALKGYVNGYYYPLIHVEHMDDPKSRYTMLKDDESIRRMRDVTFVLREHNITTMEERWKRRAGILSSIHSDPWQAEYYVGWRAKLRRAKAKIRGVLKA